MPAARTDSPEMRLLKLQQAAKAGATWFYWIAGLSAANSVSLWLKAGWSFFAGLGITQLFDVIGARLGTFGTIAAMCFDLVVVGAFCLIGYVGRTRRGALVAGMILYALDGLLLLAFGAFAAAAFHLFALVFMFKGYTAAGTLERLASMPPDATVPAVADVGFVSNPTVIAGSSVLLKGIGWLCIALAALSALAVGWLAVEDVRYFLDRGFTTTGAWDLSLTLYALGLGVTLCFGWLGVRTAGIWPKAAPAAPAGEAPEADGPPRSDVA